MHWTNGGAVRVGLFSLFAVASATNANSQPSNPDRDPGIIFSIADLPPNRTADGPLFQRISAAFTAANEENGDGFLQSLAQDSELQMMSYVNSEVHRQPLNIQVVRAIIASCVGPFSYDEARSWVQLSWICRTDGVGPLASLVAFRNSPELSMTVRFENDLVKSIVAMEPITLPGRPVVAMNAFQVLQSRR